MNIKKWLNHVFIDGLSGMATGLFATLIIGTIIQQIGLFIDGTIGDTLYFIGKIFWRDSLYFADFSPVFLFSISLISAIIFIIFFFLLPWFYFALDL